MSSPTHTQQKSNDQYATRPVFSDTHLILVHSVEGDLARPVQQIGETDEGVRHIHVEYENGGQKRHPLYLQRAAGLHHCLTTNSRAIVKLKQLATYVTDVWSITNVAAK